MIIEYIMLSQQQLLFVIRPNCTITIIVIDLQLSSLIMNQRNGLI